MYVLLPLLAQGDDARRPNLDAAVPVRLPGTFPQSVVSSQDFPTNRVEVCLLFATHRSGIRCVGIAQSPQLAFGSCGRMVEGF
jgi:hypothetical protein